MGMKNKKVLITAFIAALLALVLVSGWYILFSQYHELQASFEALQQQVAEGIDEQSADLDKLQIQQHVLQHNLNESRAALKLPEVPDFSSDEDAPEQDRTDDGSMVYQQYPDDLFFRGIRYFSEYYRMQKLAYRMADLMETIEFTAQVEASGLTVRKTGTAQYALVKNDREDELFLVEAFFDEEKSGFRVQPASGEVEIFYLEDDNGTGTSAESAAEELGRYISSETVELEERNEEFLETARLLLRIVPDMMEAVLRGQDHISLEKCTGFNGNPGGGPRGYSDCVLAVTKRDPSEVNKREVLFSLGVEFPSGRLFIDEETFTAPEDFRTALEKRLESVDPRTAAEKRVAEMKERLMEMSRDGSFTDFLEEQGLRMDSKPRESGDYFSFDLYDGQGRRYGAFSVLKKVGGIYLTDPDDVPVASLMTVQTAPELKTRTGKSRNYDIDDLPDAASYSMAGRATGSTLLLCGTHERNADTIIIARLMEGEEVRLLSVPRDLYYRYRKLNTHYRTYGIGRLQTILEEMTGVQFDGYISVDMYAFIDIVDLLDGINIVLDAPLRDPTYRIRDRGEWTTLSYPAGRHHLSGVEALRVVRSRHTSDDFDRSYRQQLVIRALWDRLNQMHAGKLKEVYDIFNVLVEYVDTDLSAYEMAQFFLQYRDAEIEPRKSISTDNVLYTTYSNFYLSGLEPDDVDEDFDKGAWILLPLDDDWSLIPRYVQQELGRRE